MSVSCKLTCCRARRIHKAVYYVVPLHPPLDLWRLYLAASHREHERALVSLDKLPLLTLSHDRLHLLRLNVLIFSPLADT
jgi:hypothetical protein